MEKVEEIVNRARNGQSRPITDKKDKDGRTPLLLAAAKGYKNVAMILLEHGAKIDSKDNFDRTALQWAVEGGHRDVVKFLRDKGIDVNATDKYGRSPFWRAAWRGHADIINILLESKPEPRLLVTDMRRRTELHAAAMAGQTRVVGKLLTHPELSKNIPKKDDEDRTALHLAAEKGHQSVIRIILENVKSERRASLLDARDKDGKTALVLAKENGHDIIVQLLKDSEGKNGRYASALSLESTLGPQRGMQKAIKENMEIEVKKLLDEHSSEPATFGEKSLILHLAAEKGYKQVFDLLLKKCKNINEQDRNGRTALHVAAMNGSYEAAKLLLDQKEIDASRPDRDGKTALHLAAVHGGSMVLKRLLDSKLNPEARDMDGRTPLHLAAMNGKVDSATVLLATDKTTTSAEDLNGQTPLHLAARSRSIEVVDAILAEFAKSEIGPAKLLGVSVDHQDHEGATALGLAAAGDSPAIIKSLLKYGANPEAIDDFGMSPEQVASQNTVTEIQGVFDEYRRQNIPDSQDAGITVRKRSDLDSGRHVGGLDQV